MIARRKRFPFLSSVKHKVGETVEEPAQRLFRPQTLPGMRQAMFEEEVQNLRGQISSMVKPPNVNVPLADRAMEQATYIAKRILSDYHQRRGSALKKLELELKDPNFAKGNKSQDVLGRGLIDSILEEARFIRQGKYSERQAIRFMKLSQKLIQLFPK